MRISLNVFNIWHISRHFSLSLMSLCIAVQPRGSGYRQVAVGIDLLLVRHVHGDGREFLCGERMPVPDGAAEVLLGVVVVAPLRQPHGRDVLVHVHDAAVPGRVRLKLSMQFKQQISQIPDGDSKSEKSRGRRVG